MCGQLGGALENRNRCWGRDHSGAAVTWELSELLWVCLYFDVPLYKDLGKAPLNLQCCPLPPQPLTTPAFLQPQPPPVPKASIHPAVLQHPLCPQAPNSLGLRFSTLPSTGWARIAPLSLAPKAPSPEQPFFLQLSPWHCMELLQSFSITLYSGITALRPLCAYLSPRVHLSQAPGILFISKLPRNP